MGGGWGLGGKGLVRDWLGVIAQVVAIAVPPMVAAAVPRELRIDPREKKKSREPRPAAPWSIDGRSRGRGSHWHARDCVVIFFSGKTGTKFSKKIQLLPKNGNELVVNWNTRVFN